MKVNMNGLRKNLTRNYNGLHKKIGEVLPLLDDNEQDEIKRILENIGDSLLTLNCTQSMGDDDFDDISDEVELLQFDIEDEE